MTEEEWLVSEDPLAMHAVVADGALDYKWPRGNSTARKRAFFGASCCRLVWPFIVVDERCRRSIELLETQFDLNSDESDIDNLGEEIAQGVRDAARHPEPDTPLLQAVAANMVYDAGGDCETMIRHLLFSFDEWGDPAERGRHAAHLLREIVGNPFRPVAFSPEWRTSTAVALAQQMYDSRDFALMPILGDALQDAGCDSDDILDHCRGAGPHVRGCWVVDLVLGKE
jgi:hypothetical protein